MLTLIRGLPGSGKSTLAKRIRNREDIHIEADMYFVIDGAYKFDISKLKEAHDWCQRSVKLHLSNKRSVIVSNTFSQLWEMKPYIKMATENNIKLIVVECQSNFDSIHNVPEDAIIRMKNRWEKYYEK